MKMWLKQISASGLLFLLMTLVTVAAPPLHDSRTNALELNATNLEWLNFDLDFSGATAEAGDPSVPVLPDYNLHGSVWMKWTPTHWSGAELQSYAANNGDSLVAVFSSDEAGNLTYVNIGSLDGAQCGDDGCHRIGWVDVNLARPGTTYYYALVSPADSLRPLPALVNLRFILGRSPTC